MMMVEASVNYDVDQWVCSRINMDMFSTCFSACIKEVAGTGKREMKIFPTCRTLGGKGVLKGFFVTGQKEASQADFAL